MSAVGEARNVEIKARVADPVALREKALALADGPPELIVQIEGAWDLPPAFGFNMGFTAVFEEATVILDINTGKPLTLLKPDGSTETPKMPSDKDGYFNEIV